MSTPKNIIVTGASRGIGLAIAKHLLQAQHKVFLVARTREPLEGLKKEFPGQVEYLTGDLKDFEVGLSSSSFAVFSLYFSLPLVPLPGLEESDIGFIAIA